MTAGTRPAARKFLAPFRRDCVRGYAFNGTDFIVKLCFSAAPQLVRPFNQRADENISYCQSVNNRFLEFLLKTQLVFLPQSA
jgi:hypothetical protein